MAAEQLLVLKKTLSDNPERVFQAWTDPEVMGRWFFPAPDWSAQVSADLRPGGAWRVEMRDAAGVKHVQFGEYREIQPTTRLVFTWSCPELGVKDSTVTIELKGRGERTDLTLTHALPADPKIVAEHEGGWNGCLGQLERFLSTPRKEQ
jgi:uncharacterized protein YndB with AHSA1/START domain